MFGHHSQRVVVVGIAAVRPAAQLGGAPDQRVEQIRFIYRPLALEDDGRALEAHACVYVGRGQRRALAGCILVELHEHQVPHFYEPIAGLARAGQCVLAVGAAVGPQASAVRAEVVVDLAAGTARAFASRGAPEVVLLVESADSLGRHSRAGGPQMKGLAIVSKDGGPDAIRLQPQALGDELPSEANGVLLEVIADAEVAEHLEEGEVCCVANLAHVRGPEALLR